MPPSATRTCAAPDVAPNVKLFSRGTSCVTSMLPDASPRFTTAGVNSCKDFELVKNLGFKPHGFI